MEKRKRVSVGNDRREAVSIPSDVNGSYTGMSHDGSPPIQDADDL